MMPRWTTFATAVAVAALFAGCSADQPQESVVETAPSELEQLLYDFKVAWNPVTKDRMFERVRAAGHLHQAIAAICADTGHRFFPEALQIVERLGRRDAVPHLRKIAVAGPDHLRRQALLAAHRIKPLQYDEVDALLVTSNAELLLGVLDVCRTMDRIPTARIGNLLFASDDRIRAAARRAVPRKLPTEIEQLLIEVVDIEREPGRMQMAMEVLRQCEVTVATERILHGLLYVDDPDLRIAALHCLANKPGRLNNPDPVWEIAVDPVFGPRESAQAFHCLECTRSFSVEKVLNELSDLQVVQRYQAARCLLVAGHKEGVRVMLELYEELARPESEGQIDAGDRMMILTSVRQVLARMSGSRAGEGPREWRRWFEGLSDLTAQALPPAPVGG